MGQTPRAVYHNFSAYSPARKRGADAGRVVLGGKRGLTEAMSQCAAEQRLTGRVPRWKLVEARLTRAMQRRREALLARAALIEAADDYLREAMQ